MKDGVLKGFTYGNFIASLGLMICGAAFVIVPLLVWGAVTFVMSTAILYQSRRLR